MFKAKILISISLLLLLFLPNAIALADTAEDALTEEKLTHKCEDDDPTTASYSFTTFIEEKAGSMLGNDFDPKTARVVELSESLSSENSETAISGSIIVSAYKGYCCKDSLTEDGRCTSEIISVYEDDPVACENIADLCTPIQLIISTSGINLLKFYAMQLYRWAASIVGIICVLLIVISGIQITASRGEDISSAKNRITQALAGLALLFLSALILYTINPTFFTN
ncbi:MAG: hypothetical protein UV80_C0001G0060 [Candidatus Peregrinibacteria bacterium GW2011_GWF2_43_17]|nr:MAG: hypothetical protein UV80_C0001G0060 [Candidatus Peregrinibacteria bacterium GW2011_GWF2_43_17]KKT20493.1 MAG: hypothetical protein UW03_C0003G0029 [Candidatus Peregrinibacteria bacterium GW2011_GWA2_43_8]HAU40302.1 hypothetical protein [Candidatus Peregrinibacteria bacterium]